MDSPSRFRRLRSTPSRKGLWIGLVVGIGAIALCVCFLLVAAIYAFRQGLPLLSRLFPMQTPGLSFYKSPIAGASFYYPASWTFEERGDSINNYYAEFLSYSQPHSIPYGKDQQKAEAGLSVSTGSLDNLPFVLDASNLIEDIYRTNLVPDETRTFTMSGFPAASGLTLAPPGDDDSYYDVVVLRKRDTVFFAFFCDRDKLADYRPIFETIIKSARITSVH